MTGFGKDANTAPFLCDRDCGTQSSGTAPNYNYIIREMFHIGFFFAYIE
jgi:hypothetical protein